jgi:hypothetical protein
VQGSLVSLGKLWECLGWLWVRLSKCVGYCGEGWSRWGVLSPHPKIHTDLRNSNKTCLAYSLAYSLAYRLDRLTLSHIQQGMRVLLSC